MIPVNNDSDNQGLGHCFKEENVSRLMRKIEFNTKLLISFSSVVHMGQFSLQTVESPPAENSLEGDHNLRMWW